MDRAVIIPALNPEACLEEITDRLWEQDIQIVVVDDGSREDCLPFFCRLGAKCTVLHHKENRGKGAAIKTGLAYIREELWECSVVGIMDADGQHLPEDMEKLLRKAAGNPEALILGSRTMDGSVPWKSRAGNLITSKVFRLASGADISDTQTGLRAFSRELLDFMLGIPGERYEYEMSVLVACAREKVPMIEVPIRTIYHDKNNSCSRFRHVRDSVRIYRQLLRFSAASFTSFLLDFELFGLFSILFPDSALGIAGANIGARLISGSYNYAVNCWMVFGKKGSVKTAADYAALAACILALNSILLQGFHGILHVPLYAAKLLTEVLLFLISWTVQKKLIFGRHAGVLRTCESAGAEKEER